MANTSRNKRYEPHIILWFLSVVAVLIFSIAVKPPAAVVVILFLALVAVAIYGIRSIFSSQPAPRHESTDASDLNRLDFPDIRQKQTRRGTDARLIPVNRRNFNWSGDDVRRGQEGETLGQVTHTWVTTRGEQELHDDEPKQQPAKSEGEEPLYTERKPYRSPFEPIHKPEPVEIDIDEVPVSSKPLSWLAPASHAPEVFHSDEKTDSENTLGEATEAFVELSESLAGDMMPEAWEGEEFYDEADTREPAAANTEGTEDVIPEHREAKVIQLFRGPATVEAEDILLEPDIVEETISTPVKARPEFIRAVPAAGPVVPPPAPEQETAKDTDRSETLVAPVVTPPSMSVLHKQVVTEDPDDGMVDATAQKLINTLKSFGVGATVLDVSVGPTVTRYEIAPQAGVKVSKIVGLADDIALNLAATGVRIEAPIPGKAAVGIEVPNKETRPVFLGDVLETPEFMNHTSPLAFAVGKDIGGRIVVGDIARMPHMLIAGATGAGKSVCINSLIASILFKSTPEEVRLLMVDPKVVELGIYNGIPHLLIPVVTDPRKAAGALAWAVLEMTNRYKWFAEESVRDLNGYNNVMRSKGLPALPRIVIIIDELADLMMVAPGDVEDAIMRLAQMARAAGMHLIIATQRPSVDVITGVIKANIPSRIAFAVSSQIDSRTILDMAGAEKLIGRGDMLYYPLGENKPLRVQGAFVSDKEVEDLVRSLKSQAAPAYDEDILARIDAASAPQSDDNNGADADDELFGQAVETVLEAGQASASFLQRKLKVGYSRAARILDQMENWGIVGPQEGSKPRQIRMTLNEWRELNN